jgi:hypothetical protein
LFFPRQPIDRKWPAQRQQQTKDIHGQLVRQQAAGEADLRVQGLQGRLHYGLRTTDLLRRYFFASSGGSSMSLAVIEIGAPFSGTTT